MFKVKSVVITTTHFCMVNGQGCHSTWRASTRYETHAIASYCMTTSTSTTTYSYQCKLSPMNQFCGQAGFEPHAISGYWTQAWIQLAACTWSATPTLTLALTQTPSYAAWSGNGCPNSYAPYTAYNAGDFAKKGGIAYQCKAFPYNAFCGSVGYEPAGIPKLSIPSREQR